MQLPGLSFMGGIETQCSVSLHEQPRSFERSISLIELLCTAAFSPMFGDDQRAGIEQRANIPAKKPKCNRILVSMVIGRIEEDEVEGLRETRLLCCFRAGAILFFRSPQEVRHTAGMYAEAANNAKPGKV